MRKERHGELLAGSSLGLEMTHVTSACISLAKANHMATPEFTGQGGIIVLMSGTISHTAKPKVIGVGGGRLICSQGGAVNHLP